MWTENVAIWFQGHNKSALQAILLDRVDELGERASQRIKCRHLHIVCNCWVKDWKVWVQTLGEAYFVQYQIHTIAHLPCQHIERTTLYFISGTVHLLKCTGVQCSCSVHGRVVQCSRHGREQLLRRGDRSALSGSSTLGYSLLLLLLSHCNTTVHFVCNTVRCNYKQ